MRKLTVSLLVALMSVPQFTHAQAYKCKQPDGSTAFQDRPCASGLSGSKIDLNPAQGYSADDATRSLGTNAIRPGGRNSMSPPGLGGADSANARIDAENARIEAENRRIRCDQAQHRLGVLKEERPVYHYDKNGNKVYVEDADRPAAIAAAQQSVAAACN